MNAADFRKWLAARGCTFETHRGGSGHVRMLLGDRRSILPMHGSK